MFQTQATLYSTVVIIILIAVLIIIFFAYIVLRKQKQFSRIQRKATLSEMLLLEKERTRISRDLHDETGSLLQSIKINIKMVMDHSANATTHLKTAGIQIDQAIDGLSDITRNLTPRTLDQKGFRIAMEDYLYPFIVKGEPLVEFEYRLKEEPVTETALQMYRIIQEMVQNTIKHARCNRMLILIAENEKYLFITCKDDGCGFDPAAVHKGLGLHHLKNRTALLGGKLRFKSTPEKGTEYYLKIPKKFVYGG